MTTLTKTVAFRMQESWVQDLDKIAAREKMSRGQLLRNLVLTMFMYEMECFINGQPSALFELSEVQLGDEVD